MTNEVLFESAIRNPIPEIISGIESHISEVTDKRGCVILLEALRAALQMEDYRIECLMEQNQQMAEIAKCMERVALILPTLEDE